MAQALILQLQATLPVLQRHHQSIQLHALRNQNLQAKLVKQIELKEKVKRESCGCTLKRFINVFLSEWITTNFMLQTCVSLVYLTKGERSSPRYAAFKVILYGPISILFVCIFQVSRLFYEMSNDNNK